MQREKLHSFISYILKFLLLAMAILTLIRGEYVWFIGTMFALFLTMIPTILERDFFVQLPLIFDVAITISIFLHVVGGYVRWYESIPYYDHLTHFLSSATISLIGVTLLYIIVFSMNRTYLPPLFFGFFTVIFTISMGVIWEFLEWGFDIAFGTELQLGLNDTMWDLVFDTLAGIIVGASATIQLKRGEGKRFRDIRIGDVKSSTAYRRWQMLTDKNVELKDKINTAFRDPIILEGIFDYVVKEYKQISLEEAKLWNQLKKREKKRDKR